MGLVSATWADDVRYQNKNTHIHHLQKGTLENKNKNNVPYISRRYSVKKNSRLVSSKAAAVNAKIPSCVLGWANFSKSSQIVPFFLYSMCMGKIRSHAKFQVSSFNILNIDIEKVIQNDLKVVLLTLPPS